MKVPDNMVPLVYLFAVAIIAGGLTILGVTPEMTGLIIGAGVTRIKASPAPASESDCNKT